MSRPPFLTPRRPAAEAMSAATTRRREGFVVDAAAGVDLLYLPPDSPDYAAALQAVRDCGLTAALMTVTPNGRRHADATWQSMRQRLLDYAAVAERNADQMLVVRSRADLERARRERKLGVVFAFQGAEPVGEDLDRVRLFRDAGLRVLQLTHNQRNLIGDGNLEPGNAGLSNHGRALIERIEAERIVVDLAHGAQRTTREAILAATRPLLVSHSGCRALADSPRLLADAELKLLAGRGGVVGVIFWPYLRVQGQQTAEDVIRHVEHAIAVCGEDHVGLGSDLSIAPTAITPAFREQNAQIIRDAIAMGAFAADRDPELFLFPPDLNTADRFGRLADLLAARGHADARIDKILGGNFARVLGEVWG
ncbi:dipeptidase [Tahibacter caeni]|uniref:dipeptidase n=1 Tax=Tahibacter caeni TaxID=1453545 RepID=UPI002147801E|nr:dipeptidase [Tahibacter caeni]